MNILFFNRLFLLFSLLLSCSTLPMKKGSGKKIAPKQQQVKPIGKKPAINKPAVKFIAKKHALKKPYHKKPAAKPIVKPSTKKSIEPAVKFIAKKHVLKKPPVKPVVTKPVNIKPVPAGQAAKIAGTTQINQLSQLKFTSFGSYNPEFGRQLNILTHNLPGVYHLYSDARVPQNRGWSCGFHCLYNAKTIDTTLGIRNISDNTYIQAIQNQIPNPSGASSNIQMSRLARTFGLNAYNLHFDDNGRVIPLFDGGTSYTYQHGESPQAAYQRAFRNQETAMWTQIHNTLNRNGTQTVHFISTIMSGNTPHAILVSVVKDANGRCSLDVFDNMNNREPQQARNEMVQQIRYVHQHILYK